LDAGGSPVDFATATGRMDGMLVTFMNSASGAITLVESRNFRFKDTTASLPDNTARPRCGRRNFMFAMEPASSN
jgi:hypothetical protein